MKARREALGGSLPARREQAEESLEIPSLKIFDAILKGSGEREVSSTMTFVRVLNSLLKDKKIGKRIVPIIPDEARTFGMEGLFRQVVFMLMKDKNTFLKMLTKLLTIVKIKKAKYYKKVLTN